MSKQKKHGFLFYCIAVLFFPITICVLLCKALFGKKKSDNQSKATGRPDKCELYAVVLNGYPLEYCDSLSENALRGEVDRFLREGSALIPDGIHKLSTTKVPKVYFEYVELIEKYLSGNFVIQKFYPQLFTENPFNQYRDFESKKLTYNRAFLDRYYNDTFKKCVKLNSAQEQRTFVQAAYNALDYYAKRMTNQDVLYFREQFNKLLGDISKCL